MIDLQSAKVYDLGQPYFPGMPHYPVHPPFLFGLTKAHGEVVGPAGRRSGTIRSNSFSGALAMLRVAPGQRLKEPSGSARVEFSRLDRTRLPSSACLPIWKYTFICWLRTAFTSSSAWTWRNCRARA